MTIDTLITNAIRADVRAIGGYHVPDASGFIKLDAMENPYELPEHLRVALAERLAGTVLNRYPAPAYTTLKEKLCATQGIPAGYNVSLGNGSDELISIVAMATAQQGARATVVAPVPAFVMYPRSAQFAGMDFIGVPLRADFTLDLPAMLAAIREHQPKLVFIAYPNNPTGNLYGADEIVAIIDALGDTGIAVVDEAYEPFARTSFMERLPRHDNLVVMRTLSKLGLAGIRLGYMSAHPKLLEQFEKVRPPYNVNILTQVAAEFALDHVDVLNEQAAAINAERATMAAALGELNSVEVFPSAANFLLLRVPDADKVVAAMVAEKILIKNLSKMHPLLANCIRVTVSTPQENAIFLNILTASLN